MQTLNAHDIYWCVRRLPKPVFEMLHARGTMVAVAGGYIRSCINGDPIQDVDLFSRNKDVATLLASELAEKVNAKAYHTDNALTVKVGAMPVQFIHRWTFENAQQIVDSFDFTIARVALWFDRDKRKWQSLCDDRFYADLAGRRLVYCSPVREEEAGGSMLRILKFYQRGYRIPLDSLGAVIARMAVAVLEPKIQRMIAEGLTKEQATATVLTGLLREVDPLIDPHRLSHLPSEETLTQIDGEGPETV